MAEVTVKPAGTYELKNFNVTPISGGNTVDIKRLIHTWEIIESVKSGAVKGSAKVYDAAGFLYNLPLRGQEKIEVVYTDWRGVELTETFILYSVSDVKPLDDNIDRALQYTITFVSVGKFVSDKYDVRRCIANGSGSHRTYLPVSQQAEILFRDYFQDQNSGKGTTKELVITDTDGPQKLIIPSLRPEEAMHFLTRKAWSASLKSQMFRFFETRERYYFANLEDLIAFPENDFKTIYSYRTGPQDTGPDGELYKMQSIVSYNIPSFSNSHQKMINGAFFRKTNELNINERIEIVNEYRHLDEYENYIYPDGEGIIKFINDDSFINEYLNDIPTNYVIKDYPGPDDPNSARQRPATYYPDIYNRKSALAAHLAGSSLNVTIYGNNKLFPGMIIQIELPKFKEPESPGYETDEDRSGWYLIESIQNIFHEFTYYQKLSLVKGGIKG